MIMNNMPPISVEDYYETQTPGLYRGCIPNRHKLEIKSRSKSTNRGPIGKFYYPKLQEFNVESEDEDDSLLPPIILVYKLIYS